MNIPINIAREINRFVDDPKWRDFFDSALKRYETPSLRALGGCIIIYNFRSALLHTSAYEQFRQYIEVYGENGFRVFFLHMILDLIERNTRSGKEFAFLKVEDVDGFYKEYIEEVNDFLNNRMDEVLADIKNYIQSRRR